MSSRPRRKHSRPCALEVNDALPRTKNKRGEKKDRKERTGPSQTTNVATRCYFVLLFFFFLFLVRRPITLFLKKGGNTQPTKHSRNFNNHGTQTQTRHARRREREREKSAGRRNVQPLPPNLLTLVISIFVNFLLFLFFIFSLIFFFLIADSVSCASVRFKAPGPLYRRQPHIRDYKSHPPMMVYKVLQQFDPILPI